MGGRGRVAFPTRRRRTSAALDAPVVVAVDAVVRRKGFDRLLKGLGVAFSKRTAPRIGTGSGGPGAEELIDTVLRPRLRAPPRVPLRMLDEFASASLFAFTSRREVSMCVAGGADAAVGPPVVALTCRTGPADIIRGRRRARDPERRTRLFVEALGELIDTEQRRRFGAAALDSEALPDRRHRRDRREALFDEPRPAAGPRVATA